MVKIVEITQSSDTVTCDKNGQATIQFNITNINSSSLRVGAKIITEEPTQQSWFTLEGNSEKKLDINATDQFSVRVSAENASEGSYKVRLLVYNIENSDEEYTESESISVNIPSSDAPPPQPPAPFPKWIIWVLVGIVIAVLLGVIGYLAFKDNDPKPELLQAIVPDVTGKMFDDAKAQLENLEFTNIETEPRFDASKAKDMVLEQTPEAGSKEDPSKIEIILVLADSTTNMPDLKDLTLQGAKGRLREKGFRKINIVPKFDLSNPVGTVLEQSPQAGISVSSNETEVTLTVANHGITVPNVKGILLRAAINRLTAAKLSIDAKITSKFDKTKREDTVRTQIPNAGKKVKEGTPVKLEVSTQKRTWIIQPKIKLFLMKPKLSRGILPEE